MTTTQIVILVLVLLAVAAVVAAMMAQAKKRKHLQSTFGPEYDRTVEGSGRMSSERRRLRRPLALDAGRLRRPP